MSGPRTFIATLVLGFGVAGAVAAATGNWRMPVAILIGFLGVGLTVIALTARRAPTLRLPRRTLVALTAVLVAAVACFLGAAGAYAVSGVTATRSHLAPECVSHSALPANPVCGFLVTGRKDGLVFETYTPGWVVPLTALVGLLGLAAATAVLAIGRRRLREQASGAVSAATPARLG